MCVDVVLFRAEEVKIAITELRKHDNKSGEGGCSGSGEESAGKAEGVGAGPGVAVAERPARSSRRCDRRIRGTSGRRGDLGLLHRAAYSACPGARRKPRCCA